MADINADVRETLEKTEAQILAGGIKAGQYWIASDTKTLWRRSADGLSYENASGVINGGTASLTDATITSMTGTGVRNVGADATGKLVELDFPEGNVIEITTDTNAVTDSIYLVDTTAGAVTLTLPATLVMGFNVRVYKISDITTPEVIIDGNGNLIGPDATQAIVGESEGVSIISDGQYFIVQDNRGGLQRKLSQSTGILSGFEVSTNVDGVSIDILPGIYVIEDATDMLNPTSTTLQYDGVTGYPISNLSTEGITFVFIDAAGVLSQQTNVTTSPEQWHTVARFATVQHFFGSGAIETTLEYATPPNNPASRISTFMNTIGIIREGVVISGASANNLQIANTSGTLVSPGSNQITSSINPDNVPISASDPVAAIVYLSQNDVIRLDTGAGAIVDVLNYDVAGTPTLIPGNSTTSCIHRVYIGIDGTIAVQYGQNTYATLGIAKDALFSGEDTFIENPILNKITTLLCYVIVTKGATSLNSATDALLFVTDKFGSGGSISTGGPGSSTTQEGYDNSISNPELLTNDTRLALDIRNGSSLDTNSVLTVQDIAGTKILDVTGEKVIVDEALNVSSTGISQTVLDEDLLIETNGGDVRIDAPVGISTSAPNAPLEIEATTASEGVRVCRNGVPTQYISLHELTGGSHEINFFGNKSANFTNDATTAGMRFTVNNGTNLAMEFLATGIADFKNGATTQATVAALEAIGGTALQTADSVRLNGVTGSRPTTTIGRMYFDTTLGIPIWYDGTNWVDATGATV